VNIRKVMWCCRKVETKLGELQDDGGIGVSVPVPPASGAVLILSGCCHAPLVPCQERRPSFSRCLAHTWLQISSWS
jgi:hypothetical protein